MNKLWQACSVAGYNFRQWHKNPRIFIAFSLAFILCFLLSDKVVKLAEKFDTSTQILEPFIWTFGDSSSILLASLLLVFLFADMPFISGGTPLYVVRTSRRVWLAGQVIYVACSTLLYMIFVMTSTSLICMQHSFVGNKWSQTAAMLGYSGTGEAVALPAAVKTMERTRPYQCAAVIFLLMLLYSLLMVMVMLVCNLYKGQAAGMAGVSGFSVWGLLLSPDVFQTVLQLEDRQKYIANIIVGWLSPLNHATYQMHNFGYDQLPRMWQTCVIFLLLIFLCVLLAWRLIRGYSFTFTGTEGEG